MDERNLKIAFAKVKRDILSIKNQIEDLKISNNKTYNFVESKKFDNFISNIETELNNINLFLKEVDDKSSHSLDLSSTHSDIMQRLEDSYKSIDPKISEISEMLSEKISFEISSLKLDFTTEIAKLYDKFFAELIDMKKNIRQIEKREIDYVKPIQESIKEPIKKETKKNKIQIQEEEDIHIKAQNFSQTEAKETKTSKKKGNRLKNVLNWLFIDEEEQEESLDSSQLKTIKEDIKNNKKE